MALVAAAGSGVVAWRLRDGRVLLLAALAGVAAGHQLLAWLSATQGGASWPAADVWLGMAGSLVTLLAVLVLGHLLVRARRSEEALYESEARYRKMVELSPDGIAVLSAGRFRYINTAAAEIMGTSDYARLAGRSLLDFIPAERRELVEERVLNVEEGAVTPSLEQRLQRLDGTSVSVEMRAVPVRYLDQTNVLVMMRDISKRRQAEAQLRAQATLLQEAQDAIYVRDLAGHLVYWNKGAERLYGWKMAEAIDRPVDALLFRADEPLLDEALQAMRSQGEWTGELHQVSRAGKELIVDSRWTLVPGEGGKDQCILVVNTDISDRKQLETQLLRAQRLESIGRLASGLAHDLNNVLNPIVMASGLLDTEALDEEGRELVHTIEASAQRGRDILKQVLTFARGAPGAQHVLQPDDIIRDIERLIRETFPRDIRVQVDMQGELWTIWGNRTQLDQVLMNLCVNARDAMPGGGILTISACNRTIGEAYARKHFEARPGPHVVITVSDTGEGIPPGVLDKIFEPFFTTKRPGEGTGLGLSTVHSIVRSQHGFINVHSKPGAGTTFVICLPAAEASVAAPKQRAPLALRRGKGELILLVDDEADILALGRKMLEENGYRVLTACDGNDALSLYRQHQADVCAVITDLMMPNMDGFATVRALVAVNPAVRILASSGYINEQSVLNLAQAGAHVFLPKPYTAKQLLAALHRLFQMETSLAAS